MEHKEILPVVEISLDGQHNQFKWYLKTVSGATILSSDGFDDEQECRNNLKYIGQGISAYFKDDVINL